MFLFKIVKNHRNNKQRESNFRRNSRFSGKVKSQIQRRKAALENTQSTEKRCYGKFNKNFNFFFEN